MQRLATEATEDTEKKDSEKAAPIWMPQLHELLFLNHKGTKNLSILLSLTSG